MSTLILTRFSARQMAKVFMADITSCNCEQSLRLKECLEHSNAVIEAQSTELAQYKADFAEIAGHFTIPAPEPGTVTAKLLTTINVLKGQIRELVDERNDLKAELKDERRGHKYPGDEH